MSKHKLTIDERTARIERRRTLREAAAERVTALREWHLARSDRASKAARTRTELLRSQPRGVDRVPSRLQGLAPTVEPYPRSADKPGRTGRDLAQPSDLDPRGNYAARRAQGERGKPRKPRRREMPGAVQRRLDRAQKAWLAAAKDQGVLR